MAPTSSGDRDSAWMARALELARAGGLRGEVPVGAVIVQGGMVLAESHNRTANRRDPTAHAELVAIAGPYRQIYELQLRHQEEAHAAPTGAAAGGVTR